MIPHIIHYCWFGKSEMPKSAKRCIESWKKYFPGYMIKEWNEDNYDVKKNTYISQAYNAQKYAFVSDYARFDIIYNYGGIYFDTDVEVISSYEDIISKGNFIGCETDYNETRKGIQINPGLGFGAEAGNSVLKKLIDQYDKMAFKRSDGSCDTTTVVKYTTDLMRTNGLQNIPGIQVVEGFIVYPKDFFNPRDFETGKLLKTKNTRSIHWYKMTWMKKPIRIKSNITRIIHRLFGVENTRKLKMRLLKRSKHG